MSGATPMWIFLGGVVTGAGLALTRPEQTRRALDTLERTGMDKLLLHEATERLGIPKALPSARKRSRRRG